MRLQWLALPLLAALAAGCALQPRPAASPTPPHPGLNHLRADLSAAFQTPAFTQAVWGVHIRSLRTGEALFSLNADTLLMPASNMKIVTTAVAASRLGWETTFETRLVSSAPVRNNVLHGDLLIVGAGDPSLGGRPSSPAAVMDAWAAQLQQAGIRRIAGRIVGIDDTLDDQGLGQGWAWDFLEASYATPVGGLSFGENTVQLRIVPGRVPGEAAAVSAAPAGHGLTLASTLTTSAPGTDPDIQIRRLPGSHTLTIRGQVPAGRPDILRSVSVDNPTLFAAGVVRAALIERGFEIDGEAADADDLDPKPGYADAATLARWTSPPLSAILTVLMKVSQNLYADTMLSLLGRDPGDPGPGTAARGKNTMRQTLAGWGIADTTYVLADGSGLSRYNYVSPRLLTTVLAHAWSDTTLRERFLETLPIAGVDGSLAGRMSGTAAAGNARAKTGSISNARSLSGLVNSAEGEPLVFSCIVNNFNVPAAEADAVMDRVVTRLATFRRHR